MEMQFPNRKKLTANKAVSEVSVNGLIPVPVEDQKQPQDLQY